MENIPFNRPYLSGEEFKYVKKVFDSRKLSGNNSFTKECHNFFEKRYGFKKCLLTNSCTDALEMAALLANIKEGDEVIMPSFTFVSTANAFQLRGAKIIFADSSKENPNIDANSIRSLITEKTKAIVVVHYSGVACDMELIMKIAQEFNLIVIEDAAQAIDNFFVSKEQEKIALGSIGHIGCFSFHETKNIQSGEGGMIVVNDENLIERSEVLWEKGTNRSAFFRGEIDKYGWVDVGSSFLPSEITAAMLKAQLEHIEDIQHKRLKIWSNYYNGLSGFCEDSGIKLPLVPDYSTNNAHMFYLVCNSNSEREQIIKHLKSEKIHAVFHYQSLHKSSFFKEKHDNRKLHFSDLYSECLMRLPLFPDLSNIEQKKIINCIKESI